ncbi:hypothetical protein E5A86_01015 [Helicobacter pylori]|nr:hypothetical protein E5A86_01015 [Helicobacter pylori]
MWDERILKIIPALLFLFCLLEIFELVLIINDMNKTEKLEQQLRENLKLLDASTNLLNDDLVGLENLKKKHR